MTHVPTAVRRLAGAGAAAAAVVAASLTGGASPVAAAPDAATWSTAAVDCGPDDVALGGSAARVTDTAAAKEPKLFPDNQAKAYGRLPDLATMAPGSVTIETVFHVITDEAPSAAEQARLEQMVADQVQVLNDSFSVPPPTTPRTPRSASTSSTRRGR